MFKQFTLANILSPKILFPVFIALLLGVYILGRSDGSSKKETEFDVYRANSEKVIKWSIVQRLKIDSLEIIRQTIQQKYDALAKTDTVLKKKLSNIQHKLDSLTNSLDNQIAHLPTIVDSTTALTCKPWIDAVNTCKQVRAELEGKVTNLTDQVTNKTKEVENKTTEVSNLVNQKTIAVTRGDSLQRQLKLLPNPETCKIFIWFGPRCPSRASVGIIGGVIGFVGGTVLTTYIIKK